MRSSLKHVGSCLDEKAANSSPRPTQGVASTTTERVGAASQRGCFRFGTRASTWPQLLLAGNSEHQRTRAGGHDGVARRDPLVMTTRLLMWAWGKDFLHKGAAPAARKMGDLWDESRDVSGCAGAMWMRCSGAMGMAGTWKSEESAITGKHARTNGCVAKIVAPSEHEKKQGLQRAPKRVSCLPV